MPDSADIEAALVAKLRGDTTLLGYATGGVWEDEAPPGLTAFVIVALLDATDVQGFGGRAIEDPLYLVEYRELKLKPPATSHAKAAAALIDGLLDPQPPLPPATLTVPGYGLMTLQREVRIRSTEVDDRDESIRWNRRGGHYRVMLSVNSLNA